jgi:hypothetical protein
MLDGAVPHHCKRPMGRDRSCGCEERLWDNPHHLWTLHLRHSASVPQRFPRSSQSRAAMTLSGVSTGRRLDACDGCSRPHRRSCCGRTWSSSRTVNSAQRATSPRGPGRRPRRRRPWSRGRARSSPASWNGPLDRYGPDGVAYLPPFWQSLGAGLPPSTGDSDQGRNSGLPR